LVSFFSLVGLKFMKRSFLCLNLDKQKVIKIAKIHNIMIYRFAILLYKKVKDYHKEWISITFHWNWVQVTSPKLDEKSFFSILKSSMKSSKGHKMSSLDILGLNPVQQEILLNKLWWTHMKVAYSAISNFIHSKSSPLQMTTMTVRVLIPFFIHL